jgi:hypothetical protein
MKVIRIGALTVRGDLKATKKELKKQFGRWLTDEEVDALHKELKGNDDVSGTKSQAKKVRKQQGDKQ